MLARLKRGLDWRMRALASRLEAVQAGLQGVDGRLHDLQARLDGLARETAAIRLQLEEGVQPALRAVLDEEAQNRRRLYGLRETEVYELAYSDPRPLVSVTLASSDGADVLMSRTLPSLLGQTHENLEILVVGDGASPELAAAVAGLGDRRVRYGNLTQRITAHPDPRRHWLVGSTMARNEASRLATGRWLLHFDDDDHLRPQAIASLLELAREQRVEVAYGGFAEHHPDGSTATRLGFPPQPGSFGWQGALVHAGLGFFERELVAAHLGLPGDAYLLERMLRAGVRFAMLDAVVWDYYPSTLWAVDSDSDTVSQISSTISKERFE